MKTDVVEINEKKTAETPVFKGGCRLKHCLNKC